MPRLNRERVKASLSSSAPNDANFITWLFMLTFSWENWLLSFGMVPLIASLGFVPMSALAALTRQALPESFRAELASFVAALPVLPLLAIEICCHFIPFNLHLWQPILCLSAFLSFVLSAFAITRVARSTDIKSSLCLSAIVNTPLLLGTTALILLSTALDFPKSITPYTLYWTGAAIASFFLLLLSIAAGSFLGVKNNRHVLAASQKRLASAPSSPEKGR